MQAIFPSYSGPLHLDPLQRELLLVPSVSAAPTPRPTTSSAPSSSLHPTTFQSCAAFSPVALFGSQLSISDFDDGKESVALPFAFGWRGEVEYQNITVDMNGAVFFGYEASSYMGCCGAFPVELSGMYPIPRIAVAQVDLNPSIAGMIFVATVGNAFVVSWEGVPAFSAPADSQVRRNFQVALYSNGDIELRWGMVDNFSPIAAGLEDNVALVAVPASGFPFGAGGVSSEWPTNQCRRFSAVGGTYVELISR
jgi:hypothetical protein